MTANRKAIETETPMIVVKLGISSLPTSLVAASAGSDLYLTSGCIKDCNILGFEDSNRSEVDIVSLIYISETNSFS